MYPMTCIAAKSAINGEGVKHSLSALKAPLFFAGVHKHSDESGHHKPVKRNKGKAGADRQSLSDYASDLDNNLKQLLHELQSKTYQPQPVRRVEIPKDDGTKRLLAKLSESVSKLLNAKSMVQ